MGTLTLEGLMLNVIAIQAAMLGVYTSTGIALLGKALVNTESTPAACLIQQEETLMSVLVYIVMVMAVSFHAVVCKSGISSGIIVNGCYHEQLLSLFIHIYNPMVCKAMYSCTSCYQSLLYQLHHKPDPHLHLHILTCYYCHLDEGW